MLVDQGTALQRIKLVDWLRLDAWGQAVNGI
jgi:hypothetical protein